MEQNRGTSWKVGDQTKPRISLNVVHSWQGHVTTGHARKQVLEQPASQQRKQGPRSEDSSLHYAVIQVCSQPQPRSARELKHLQSENATEYATLSFPQATPCYDSKNGTLVWASGKKDQLPSFHQDSRGTMNCFWRTGWQPRNGATF